jgi:carboxyl-terminal processing protease
MLALAPAPQSWRAPALASFDEVWKTIDETFYDPTFGGVDWVAAGRELRPKVEAAQSAEEARAVIRDLLSRLKRSHFVLLSSSSDDALPGPASIPADIRITAEGALVTRVTDAAATTAGLAAGQILLAIDGRDVGGLIAVAQGSDARTKNLDAWRRVNQALHGGDASVAALRVRGVDAKTNELHIARSMGSGEVVTLGNLPPLRVEFLSREMQTPGGKRAGVIAFSVWMTAINDRFEQAIDRFRRDDGLVIDLRGNPGGLAGMMGGISGHVIAEPLLLGTMRTRQAPAPLTFRVNPRFATSDGRKVEPYAGPVALLVDELTGSTSETFAGALQSLGRARVFGRPTMGQALPALTKQLSNGDVLVHAIGDFVTSTGKSLEGDGVIPDEAVPLSPRALAEGRDQVLEAALRWFDTVKRGR